MMIIKVFYQVRDTIDSKYIAIYGDTFAIKEQLKNIGFRWNPEYRCWVYVVSNKQQLFASLKKIAKIIKENNVEYKLNLNEIERQIESLSLRIYDERGEPNGFHNLYKAMVEQEGLDYKQIIKEIKQKKKELEKVKKETEKILNIKKK